LAMDKIANINTGIYEMDGKEVAVLVVPVDTKSERESASGKNITLGNIRESLTIKGITTNVVFQGLCYKFKK